MRITLFALTAAAMFIMGGCAGQHVGCNNCRGGRGGANAGLPSPVGQLPPGYMHQDMGPAGPPTATYAYPYYTTRAPRDFLMDNPPTIGR